MSHSLEWFDLQKQARLKLEQATFGKVSSGEWDSLVMRFRKLREGLTAADAPAEVKREVYETSADVCAAANNMAELLKCLQQLVNNIYPSVAHALYTQQEEPGSHVQQHHQQQQHAEQQQQPDAACGTFNQQQCGPQQQPLPSAATYRYNQQQQVPQLMHTHPAQGGPSTPTKAADGQQQQTPMLGCASGASGLSASRHQGSKASAAAAAAATTYSSTSSSLQRLPEVAAALLLYFVCVPRQPIIQEISKQLRAAVQAQPYLSGPPMAQDPVFARAVKAVAAALRCDWCAFLQSYNGQPRMPRLVCAVMGQHVERLRIQAVRKVGLAYRMLPTETLQRWLWLQQEPCKTAAPGGQEVSFQQVVSLLQAAAADGASRAASVAAAQCLQQDGLPPTLHFRV